MVSAYNLLLFYRIFILVSLYASSPRSPTEESPVILPSHLSHFRAERMARCKSAPVARPVSAMRKSPKAGIRRLMSAKARSVSFKTDGVYQQVRSSFFRMLW